MSFFHLARSTGFLDPRVVSARQIKLVGKVATLLDPINFFSAEFRLFKLQSLEPDCEDYGQAIRYCGTVVTNPNEFLLDAHHKFSKGKIYAVCGNTFSMLKESRFASHFEFFW